MKRIMQAAAILVGMSATSAQAQVCIGIFCPRPVASAAVNATRAVVAAPVVVAQYARQEVREYRCDRQTIRECRQQLRCQRRCR